jgi:hypothetical protein
MERTEVDSPTEDAIEADGFAGAAQEKAITGKTVVITRFPDSHVSVPAWEDIVRALCGELSARTLQRA